jgi:hypothetical protein
MRDMSVQPLKLDAEDRAVYTTWRRGLIIFWGLVVIVTSFSGTILALNSTLTTEQRIEMTLHSGMFP